MRHDKEIIAFAIVILCCAFIALCVAIAAKPI